MLMAILLPGQARGRGPGCEAVQVYSLCNPGLAVSHVTSSTLFCISSLKVPTASLKRLSSRFCNSDRTAMGGQVARGLWGSCRPSTEQIPRSSQILHNA